MGKINVYDTLGKPYSFVIYVNIVSPEPRAMDCSVPADPRYFATKRRVRRLSRSVASIVGLTRPNLSVC